jgi:hypothetical protein
MLRGASFKIITSRHKQAILPSRRDFASAVRLVETVHHLPQFLELLRPGCGLATHDHLETTRSVCPGRQDADKPCSSRSDLMTP